MREWTMTTVHHGDGGLVTHNRVTWYLRLGRTVTTKMTRHDFYPFRYFSQSTSTPFTPSAIFLNQKFSPSFTPCERMHVLTFTVVASRIAVHLSTCLFPPGWKWYWRWPWRATMTMMMLTTNKVAKMTMKLEFTLVAFSLASVYLVVLFSTWEGNFKTDEISTNPFKSI